MRNCLNRLSWLLLVAASLFVATDAAGKSAALDDPLDQALAAAGIRADQLGFRPAGYWVRYPDPKQVPYINRMFDDLFAEPERIDDTLRLIAQAARDFLSPEYAAKKSDGLFRLAYYAGWDLRLSGHREYDPGLNDRPPEGPQAEDPLVFAIERLYADAGRPFDLQSMGKPADWPLRRAEARGAAAALDPALRRIVGQAVLDLADALRWRRLALRRVDGQALLRVFPLRDLTATQFDGMEYFPDFDDIARDLDEAALVTASRKVVAAAGRLEQSLSQWARETKADQSQQNFDLVTPAGLIVVSGSGDDHHAEQDVLLLVDLGGNDEYTGAAGATGSPLQGVSLAVDLAGDDRYVADDPRAPAQGSGIFGAGVLLDAAGDDVYLARFSAQGYGMFGTGLLADLAGNDKYELEAEGQGAAEFGVGLLVDFGGDDDYRIASAGQGFGGVGNGVGALIDRFGDDRYYAEPESSKYFRPDYHSQGKLNYSYAQGAAAGRRGDLMDGHSWAGGVGTLVDLAGDDEYISANWSIGSGYWYGIGWLYDGSGNDQYTASVFSLASGAHFCVGALVDESGDDRYIGYGDSHTGLAFGHDFTIALLYDGAGADEYQFGADGFGHAINMSLALFVDATGDDHYTIDRGKSGFGVTNFTPQDLTPPITRNYVGDPFQVGLFLDAGGVDAYLERDAATGAETKSAVTKDGGVRVTPTNPARDSGGRHAGIFFDRRGPKGGPVRWFAPRWSPLPPG